MKTIGFVVNLYTFRGTGIATFDYAFYNEKLLNNKSIIISPSIPNENDNPKMKKRFSCFKTIFYGEWSDVENLCLMNKIDAVYIIKYGNKDIYVLDKIPTFIHCVFTTDESHGAVYCGVSDSASRLNSSEITYPVVNHIVELLEDDKNYRKQLNIPKEAIVFGRHGGEDTFDILFVRDVIIKIASERPDVFFLFAVRPRIFENIEHPRIIYFEAFAEQIIKRRFINTCDAMIDACSLGQSFGISILEFSYCNKPVITWNGGKLHKQHLVNLGDKAVKYNDENDVYDIISSFNKDEYSKKDWLIRKFTPDFVMEQFQKVFIEKLK
jgi:hypothetical protein